MRKVLAVELIFVALAVLYSLVTPVFEGPDEVWHYAFADHLADGGGLPILDPSNPNLLLRNAAHPPLYYLPIVALIAPIDRSDFPHSFRFNLASPRVTPGGASRRPNLFIHSAHENFPYRQSALAVHLARLVSVALGALTLLGVWRVARLLLPGSESLPLLAVGLVAFIPQFVYGSGVINNDALAAAAATWCLVAVIRLMDIPTARWAVITGLLLGAALLSKIGMVALAPIPALALLLAGWQGRGGPLRPPGRGDPLRSPGRGDPLRSPGRGDPLWSPRAVIRAGMMVYAVAFAVSGWWYVRNWLLYGDPLAWRQWQALAGAHRVPPALSDFLRDMLGLFGTFWVDFTLRVDRSLAWIFILITLTALAGWLRRALRHDWPSLHLPGLIVALVWLGLLLASAIRYSFSITEIHGRLLYPALGTVGVGLAVGLSGWGGRLARWLIGGAGAILLTISLCAPFLIIEPAYARPILGTKTLPDGVTPASIRFDGAVELMGYRLVEERLSRGSLAHVRTYWRTQNQQSAQTVPDVQVVVALIRPDGGVVGHAEAMLGTEVYPSSVWQPGEIIVSDSAVKVPDNLDGPTVAEVWLSVRTEQGEVIPSEHGETVGVGRVAVRPAAACTEPESAQITLGGQIRLVGYRVDQTSVTLCWESVQTTAVDYTVFVHIFGPDGTLLGTADAPPRGGNYPTSAWSVGERIEDIHLIPALDSGYLTIGLYRPDTGERLPLDGSSETEFRLLP